MNNSLLGAAVAVIAAGSLGIWWATRPEPIEVSLAIIEPGRVDSTVANTRAGTIEACQRARMSPSIAGQIARLPVSEGDRVSAGQPLLELWNDDMRAQVALAEREIAAATARATEVCEISKVAQKEAGRVVQLQEQNIAAVETTDKAVGEAKARAAACKAAQTSAEVSEARLQAAHAAMDRTILRAPFDGIVAEINGEVGEVVTPSPVGVATLPTVDLIDTTCLYARAPIDEVDAGAIREGLPAMITLDAFPGKKYPAIVRRIAPYVLDLEKQARTVDVEVSFTDIEEAGTLLVGYSADVEIILDTREGVLRVPTEALLEGHQVLVFEDGTLDRRSVGAGLENWEFTEVQSGLDAGDRVVLNVDRDGVEDGAYVVEKPSTLRDE